MLLRTVDIDLVAGIVLEPVGIVVAVVVADFVAALAAADRIAAAAAAAVQIKVIDCVKMIG